MTRPLPTTVVLVLFLLLGSCGLSRAERNQLAQHQEAAALYYGSRDFQQALFQVERGLDIKPDDYKLRRIAAWCFLLQSDVRPERLDAAEKLFDELEPRRSTRNHTPDLLLGLGRTKLLLARRALLRAELLREEAAFEGRTEEERLKRLSRAEELETTVAPRYLDEAESSLEALIERTELLRFAHQFLVQLNVVRAKLAGDDPVRLAAAREAIERHSLACIQRVETLKKTNGVRLKDPNTSAAAEQEIRQMNDELDDIELRVRTTLATLYFDAGKFRESIGQLDMILSIDTSRAGDYYNRARAYEALGDMDRAAHNYEQFLMKSRLAPDDELVQQATRFLAKRKLGRR